MTYSATYTQGSTLHELARKAAIELSGSKVDCPVLLWDGGHEYRVQSEDAVIEPQFRVVLAQEDLDFAMYGEPIAECADEAASWILQNQNAWFDPKNSFDFIDALIPASWSCLRLGVLAGERPTLSAPLKRSQAVQFIIDQCQKRGIAVSYFEGRQNTRAIQCPGEEPLVILMF